jgi:putative ABC transport system permease protein
MDGIVGELRYAWRSLTRSGAYLSTSVTTLAIGVGAASAVYAIVHGTLLRPLPYGEPGRLMVVWETDARHGHTNRNEVALGNYIDWRERSRSFEALIALTYRTANLTGGGDPERLQAAAVSVDFFEMLRVRPVLGRGFARQEEQPAAPPVVILSGALWRRRFGADPSILGREITLNGAPATVAGVMPDDFRFEFPTSRDIDLWVPRIITEEGRASRRSHALYVVGRLRPGVTVEQAQDEMATLAAALAREHPATNAGESARVIPLSEQLTGRTRRPLLILLAAVGVVILVVSANNASLALARLGARRRDLAVQAALGASRWRMIRPIVAESVIVAAAGGALGLLVSTWITAILTRLPEAVQFPRMAEVGIDAGVVGFAVATATISSLIFSVAPALRSVRGNLHEDLKSARATGAARAATHRILVVAEVALAVLLLTGAGLLVRSFARLLAVDPGFRAASVLTFQVSLPQSTYAEPHRIARFYEELTRQLGETPGVLGAGAVSNLPLAGSNATWSFRLDGRTDPAGRVRDIHHRSITPAYFETMGMRLAGGRTFTSADGDPGRLVLIVNETLARRCWPDADPIGRQVRLGSEIDGPLATIVGVVADVKHVDLGSTPAPEMYEPQAQNPNGYMYVAVRAAGDPMALASRVRQVASGLDADLPLFKMQPLTRILSDSVARQRFTMALVTAFAALTLLLAAAGLYGVISYLISQRTRELGIRIALGARRADVQRLVVFEGLRLACAGTLAGCAAAALLTRALEAQLFGVAPTDPATFAAVTLLLLVVAAFACYVPARHASRLDPLIALRSE